jgi:hypothetical protein
LDTFEEEIEGCQEQRSELKNLDTVDESRRPEERSEPVGELGIFVYSIDS